METVLAFVTGTLFAVGIYLMMRRSIVKLVLGIALLTHAANLAVFTAAGLRRGTPPLIEEGQKALSQPHADPLPQALILTAIVISFGMQAFAVVLLRRTHQSLGTKHTDELHRTDD